jgi:hypothetical protein
MLGAGDAQLAPADTPRRGVIRVFVRGGDFRTFAVTKNTTAEQLCALFAEGIRLRGRHFALAVERVSTSVLSPAPARSPSDFPTESEGINASAENGDAPGAVAGRRRGAQRASIETAPDNVRKMRSFTEASPAIPVGASAAGGTDSNGNAGRRRNADGDAGPNRSHQQVTQVATREFLRDLDRPLSVHAGYLAAGEIFGSSKLHFVIALKRASAAVLTQRLRASLARRVKLADASSPPPVPAWPEESRLANPTAVGRKPRGRGVTEAPPIRLNQQALAPPIVVRVPRDGDDNGDTAMGEVERDAAVRRRLRADHRSEVLDHLDAAIIEAGGDKQQRQKGRGGGGGQETVLMAEFDSLRGSLSKRPDLDAGEPDRPLDEKDDEVLMREFGVQFGSFLGPMQKPRVGPIDQPAPAVEGHKDTEEGEDALLMREFGSLKGSLSQKKHQTVADRENESDDLMMREFGSLKGSLQRKHQTVAAKADEGGDGDSESALFRAEFDSMKGSLSRKPEHPPVSPGNTTAAGRSEWQEGAQKAAEDGDWTDLDNLVMSLQERSERALQSFRGVAALADETPMSEDEMDALLSLLNVQVSE